MWQDKNKEHPVFDNDPPTRFCTDYPIIILRSSLSLSLRWADKNLVYHFVIWYVLSLSFSSHSLSLVTSCVVMVHEKLLCLELDSKMGDIEGCLDSGDLPCPARPVPALHRNFVAALKSMQQIYAVRSSLSTSSCLGRITPHRAAASVEHISWNFENLHILRLPQGTQRSAAFCAVVSSLIWLIYAIRKCCAAHIRNISKQIKCCT